MADFRLRAEFDLKYANHEFTVSMSEVTVKQWEETNARLEAGEANIPYTEMFPVQDGRIVLKSTGEEVSVHDVGLGMLAEIYKEFDRFLSKTRSG